MPKKTTKRVKRNGFSPIVIVLIIAAVLALGGGYIFLSKSGNLASFPSLAPRASEKDFEFISDPLVRKNFVAQANQGSFRVKTSSGKDQETNISEVQLVGEAVNFGTKTLNVKGQEQSNMLIIGNTTYVKDYKDNAWWKQTSKPDVKPTGTSEEIKPTDFKDELTKKKQATYKQLGKEACGSLTCYKYEEVDPENNNQTRLFWFDDAQFLLRKEQVVFGGITSTSEYSYDAVSVSTPSPTKDVPEGKNIFEYLSTGEAGTTNIPTQDSTQIQQPIQNSQPEDNSSNEAPSDNLGQ